MPGDFDETRRQLSAGGVGLATSIYAAGGTAAAGRPSTTGMPDSVS
jgi:hypothetical protein